MGLRMRMAVCRSASCVAGSIFSSAAKSSSLAQALYLNRECRRVDALIGVRTRLKCSAFALRTRRRPGIRDPEKDSSLDGHSRRLLRIVVRRNRRLASHSQAAFDRLLGADGRHVRARNRQPNPWHVAVDALVLIGLYNVRLMPDTDAAVSSDSPVEPLPRLQVDER